MSYLEIKKTKSSLITWIEQLTDTAMLSVLEGLKDNEPKEDWWTNLSHEQKLHLNEGLDDANLGRVMSAGEFWNFLTNG